MAVATSNTTPLNTIQGTVLRSIITVQSDSGPTYFVKLERRNSKFDSMSKFEVPFRIQATLPSPGTPGEGGGEGFSSFEFGASNLIRHSNFVLRISKPFVSTMIILAITLAPPPSSTLPLRSPAQTYPAS